MPLPAIPIISGIVGVFKTVGDIIKNRQKRALVKSEGKIEIEKEKVFGKIEIEKNRVQGDIDYDNIVAQGMKFSWKDEYLTILISAPFIGCFIPGVQVYVSRGFEYLTDNTPEWYQWAFIGMVVASFGLKDWFKSKFN